MNALSIFPSYLAWHYSRGIREWLLNVRSALVVVARFFSITLLLRTLFAPWQRLSESPGSILNTENFFGTIAVNTLMRLVGVLIRGATILIGLGIWIGLFIILLPLTVLWIFLPIIVPVCIMVSLIGLFL